MVASRGAFEGPWIFGYGSLMWRPGFGYMERSPALVHGWVRRFWQGSPDHRGTPDRPGRVVTLVPRTGQSVRGVAYRLAPQVLGEVLERLDHRERAGYERRDVRLELPAPVVPGGEPAARTVAGLLYVAAPGNDSYRGPAPLAEIARDVRQASGPSGSNLEYVERLAQALAGIGAGDRHVAALAALLGLTPC